MRSAETIKKSSVLQERPRKVYGIITCLKSMFNKETNFKLKKEVVINKVAAQLGSQTEEMKADVLYRRRKLTRSK